MQEEMSSPSNVSPPRSATLAPQFQAPITPSKTATAPVTSASSPTIDGKLVSPAKEQTVPVSATPVKVHAENVALPETPAALRTPAQGETVTPRTAVDDEVG